jgi:hypothetical protein
VANRPRVAGVGTGSGGSGRRDRSGGYCKGEPAFGVDYQGGLIVLRHEDVIAPGLDHLLNQISLTEHRIARHHFARQGYDPQQFQRGLVFVGLGIDADLGQHRLNSRRERGDQVLSGYLAVAAPAQGLAVDRDVVERGGLDAPLDPA